MLAHRLRRSPNISQQSLNASCLLQIDSQQIRDIDPIPAQCWTNAIPAYTRHSPNAVSMLGHRLRRWLNIETALVECPVFAG